MEASGRQLPVPAVPARPSETTLPRAPAHVTFVHPDHCSKLNSRTHSRAGAGHTHRKCSRYTVPGQMPFPLQERTLTGRKPDPGSGEWAQPPPTPAPSREGHSAFSRKEPSSGGASLWVQMHGFTTTVRKPSHGLLKLGARSSPLFLSLRYVVS